MVSASELLHVGKSHGQSDCCKSLISPKFLLLGLAGQGATIEAGIDAVFEIGVQAQTKIAPPATFDSML